MLIKSSIMLVPGDHVVAAVVSSSLFRCSVWNQLCLTPWRSGVGRPSLFSFPSTSSKNAEFYSTSLNPVIFYGITHFPPDLRQNIIYFMMVLNFELQSWQAVPIRRLQPISCHNLSLFRQSWRLLAHTDGYPVDYDWGQVILIFWPGSNGSSTTFSQVQQV